MRIISLIFIVCVIISCKMIGDTTQSATTNLDRRPKLIVGITVDQMRYDYIEKYWNDYGDNGFKRLLNQGFSCRNLHYNYMPTYTGPGHASIFTGTTPAYHGIIQNDWYDRYSNSVIYCSSDTSVTGVGTSSSGGKMSPHSLIASTLGDELKLFSNQRSKVFGIAMKDRGAILPAGRTANAAYWFIGGNEGVWATSSWYMEQLPSWVAEFNKNGKAEEIMNSVWSPLRPDSVYDESIADNNSHEASYKSLLRPVFPYKLSELRSSNGNFDLIKATPFGNTLTVDFAKSLINAENLGQDEFTDMLCMSFSATDYIGHQFGIHAKETQDCYLRLDQEIADFLNYLDKKVGAGKYLVFLSADHGGAPTPSYTAKQKGTGGYWKSDIFETNLEDELVKRWGPGDWILNESNSNIFLNRKLIVEKKMDLKKCQFELQQLVSENESVLMAFNGADLDRIDSKNPLAGMAQLGYSQRMSGDVIYILKPGYIENSLTGTTHGSPYVYDTHVPAIFYGFGIQQGETAVGYNITDIAATVATICRTPLPNASIGKPIQEAIKK